MKGGGDGSDVRRLDRQQRYKAPAQTSQAGAEEDLTTDYMNVLGMIFSLCGIMLKIKWCGWLALYCSCISFANSRISENAKQIFSSFMLSVSAVVMCYLQNPQPMSPPWAASFSS